MGRGALVAALLAACGRIGFDATGLVGDAGGDGSIPSIAFASFGLGARHACALDTSGAIYCWGDNRFDQAVDAPSVGSIAVPTRMGTGTWSALAVGGEHACAIAGGAVSCWGRNSEGEATGAPGGSVLGPQPVMMAPATTPPAFAQVAAGGEASCAVGAGQLWCWGVSAAIGDGGAGNPYASQIDPAITDWKEVSLGLDYGCAISASQGVLCWGHNNRHQAVPASGLPTVTAPTAVNISGGAVPLHVFAKNSLTCAVMGTSATATAGELWCWGAYSPGDFVVPTQLGADSLWTWASPDGGSPCGVHAGQAECWASTAWASSATATGRVRRSLPSGPPPRSGLRSRSSVRARRSTATRPRSRACSTARSCRAGATTRTASSGRG
ncbi:MAG TPA: hypothetical protein VMJ10_21650 [Kofleriaceae bacterium]|nr:hypothetical protein [Kofleriaceae bacterium]